MKSVKSRSETSELMTKYLEEQRKNKHEQDLINKIKLTQLDEIAEMNRKIEQKFLKEAEAQEDVPIEIQ